MTDDHKRRKRLLVELERKLPRLSDADLELVYALVKRLKD